MITIIKTKNRQFPIELCVNGKRIKLTKKASIELEKDLHDANKEHQKQVT